MAPTHRREPGGITVAEALASVHITEVWAALGGAPLRHGRGRAFWRNGDGYNVAVDDGKGWYDFRDNRGGGVLDLVQTVLGCDRRAALQWLAETFALQIDGKPPTPAERRRYARARAEAAALLEWRTEHLRAMRQRRNLHLHAFHMMLRRILKHGLDYPGADRWADTCEAHEATYERLDSEIDQFEALPLVSLVAPFRAQRRAA